jgi:hypothetical protein
MRKIHVANASSRNSIVTGVPVTTHIDITMGKDGKAAEFKRFVAAGEGKLDSDLFSQFGGEYSKKLIDSDPEIDFDNVGRFIEETQSVLLSAKGEPLFAAPSIVEVVLDPAGNEISRGAPKEVAPTMNENIPLRWTGKKMPKSEVVRKFAFKRTMQLVHNDGVTFDFLFNMAKELANENDMVLLAAGAQGKDPIVLQVNGTPYRGFLEGRVEGDKFLLLLHLSNMELKKPAFTNSAEAQDE